MIYITSVENPELKVIKHIIDCGKGNEEIVESTEKHDYGNKKGETYFKPFYGLKVFNDYAFTLNRDSIHLAQLVVAIEKVKFIVEHLQGEK